MTTTNKSKPSLTKIIEKSFDVFQGVKESSGSGNFDKSSSCYNTQVAVRSYSESVTLAINVNFKPPLNKPVYI
jgi:hypothetical protein